jgi:sodium/myo-inositol cotransporter 11
LKSFESKLKFEKGAFWSLMAGMVIGIVRMILDFIYIEPACGEEDTRPIIIKNVSFVIKFFSIIINLGIY